MKEGVLENRDMSAMSEMPEVQEEVPQMEWSWEARGAWDERVPVCVPRPVPYVRVAMLKPVGACCLPSECLCSCLLRWSAPPTMPCFSHG